MRQEALRAALFVALAQAVALIASPVAAQPSAPPTLVDQARSANLAHALASDRCDTEELRRQLETVDRLIRQAIIVYDSLAVAEQVAGRTDSPALRQAAADRTEMYRIWQVMISRDPDCSKKPRWRIVGGYGRTYIPRVGLGFSGQQQENHAAQSERALDTGWFKSTLDTRIRRFQVGFWGQFGWGNRSTSFDLPATNQTQFGAVYTAPSPSGTSGVQLQLFGMRGQTAVRLREAQVGVEVPFKVAENETPRPTNRVFYAYSYYDRLERTHTGSIGAEATFLGNTFFFDQERRQKLDENYFAGGIGGRLEHSPGAGWIFELAARAGGYYRDSSLESVERVRSNVVPAADQDFTNVVEDHDAGFGFDSEVLFGVEHALLPEFSVFAGGTAGYRSDVGSIFNPSSSEQLLTQGLSTHIEADDMWWWRAEAGVTFRFGANGGR
jgi:hypothetical protein